MLFLTSLTLFDASQKIDLKAVVVPIWRPVSTHRRSQLWNSWKYVFQFRIRSIFLVVTFWLPKFLPSYEDILRILTAVWNNVANGIMMKQEVKILVVNKTEYLKLPPTYMYDLTVYHLPSSTYYEIICIVFSKVRFWWALLICNRPIVRWRGCVLWKRIFRKIMETYNMISNQRWFPGSHSKTIPIMGRNLSY